MLAKFLLTLTLRVKYKKFGISKLQFGRIKSLVRQPMQLLSARRVANTLTYRLRS